MAFRQRCIELDAAECGDFFRRGAQCPETGRVLLMLTGDEAHLAEHFPGQPWRQGIAPSRTLGQPGVDQQHRHAPAMGFVDEIGPELRFHQRQQFGPHSAEEGPHREWKVVGRVAVAAAGQTAADLGRTGRRGAGDQKGPASDRQRIQRRNQGRGGNGLAGGNGVKPDAPGRRLRRNPAEPLANAPAIFRFPPRPPLQAQQQGRQRQPQQNSIKPPEHRAKTTRFCRTPPRQAHQQRQEKPETGLGLRP